MVLCCVKALLKCPLSYLIRNVPFFGRVAWILRIGTRET